MIGELVYLACPYSHPDKSVRIQRFEKVNTLASYLIGRGCHLFSPISHTHPIAEAGDLALGWQYWEQYDTIMLSRCNRMYVFCLDGWKESTGVQAEIKIAKEMGIPITYLSPQYEIMDI